MIEKEGNHGQVHGKVAITSLANIGIGEILDRKSPAIYQQYLGERRRDGV